MTDTRIAGQSFDARQATEIMQLARIWGYARHIRALARTASQAASVAVAPDHPSPRRVPATPVALPLSPYA